MNWPKRALLFLVFVVCVLTYSSAAMDIGDSAAAAETRLDTEAPDWDAYPKKLNISSRAFYANYHGHKLHYVVALERLLRKDGKRIIWLLGDSSLDNKHWLYAGPYDTKLEDPLQDSSYTGPAINGYEKILRDPDRSVRDVCYWVNEAAAEAGGQYACINAAVEASTLKDRSGGRLLGHDMLVRDRASEEDVVVVSVGGNDVALRPSIKTMGAVLWLAALAGEEAIANGTAHGMGHLKRLFHEGLTAYLQNVLGARRVRRVVLCWIYHPCSRGEGWADPLLNTLGYQADTNPAKVRRIQAILDAVFEHFIATIQIDGVQVLPLQLSKVLDPDNAEHYENRVEPSVLGGMLMGHAIFHRATGTKEEEKGAADANEL